MNGALAALAFGLMSGVALAEQDYVVPEGVTLMTEDEIRSKIIRNTLGGSEYGMKWFELLLPHRNMSLATSNSFLSEVVWIGSILLIKSGWEVEHATMEPILAGA